VFEFVRATAAEIATTLPGDELVLRPDVVMDRAFTLAAPPGVVWPWLAQLGKGRAGWYLPGGVERLLPTGRRALRRLDHRYTALSVGDVIPDYGGPHETFTVAAIAADEFVVYRSRRGHTEVSWSLTLAAVPEGTRVLIRLRLAPVRHPRTAELLGGFVDLLTIAGMAAGLAERVR
jgi:hypothetical protein